MSELEHSSNQSDGSVCPTCGEQFADDHALKTHHGLAHGESIAGVEVECPQCGDTRRVKPSYAEDNENIFCDEECYGAWLSGRNTGEESHRWKRVEVECAWCGDSKMVQPHRLERNKRHFCNTGCWAEWSRENRVKEDSPAWQGGKVETECAWCGTVFKVLPSVDARYTRQFCPGGECLEAWREEYCHTGPQYYGSSWKPQREKAIQRDGERCSLCGLSREEHKEQYGVDLHVHHKIPFGQYGVDRHEEANRLQNLMTVCRSCHPQAELLTGREVVAGVYRGSQSNP
jgi:DNA-directed RNA polymerase subunit RPC12/RpoP